MVPWGVWAWMEFPTLGEDSVVLKVKKNLEMWLHCQANSSAKSLNVGVCFLISKIGMTDSPQPLSPENCDES